MEFNHSCCFPLQCDLCGRELINMGCKKCSPPPAIHPTTGSPMGIARFGVNIAQLLAKKNRGGFPKFSQLSLMTPPSSAPASPSRPRSPRKRAFGPMPPRPIRQVQFRGDDGGALSVLLTDINFTVPPTDGHPKPFGRRLKEGQELMVSTKFEWAYHKWETEIPCTKNTTETMLFRCLCIYFGGFMEAMVKCVNSEMCLCGGSTSSVTQADAKILGYELFDINESYTIVVKTGTDV